MKVETLAMKQLPSYTIHPSLRLHIQFTRENMNTENQGSSDYMNAMLEHDGGRAKTQKKE